MKRLILILFAAFIALSWHYNPLEKLVPAWVARIIYPIDKTNIDVLRFLHFLAVAWVVRLLVHGCVAGFSGDGQRRHGYKYHQPQSN
jgi:hypothetical protein